MLNVAILAGGDSGEYVVSIKSAHQVALNLDRSHYTPYVIEIKGGVWMHRHGESIFHVDRNHFQLELPEGRVAFDVVFNAIHGTPGEDGKLQGYFDLLGIPYTSCGLTTSALTFNKHYCKCVVEHNKIHVAKSVHLFRGDPRSGEKIKEKLSLPVFIKPNNGGSSVGMSKINRWEELDEAIAKAFHEDREILAEEFVGGRELTCGVFLYQGEIIALPVTEIISKKEFFDYEAKYQDGLAREVVPAEVPESVSSECQSISRFLFERLDCKGVVRFDYIYTGSEFYFLEVNTVPGMSEQSIVPKMVRAHGWTVGEFYSKLIQEAMGHKSGIKN